jgi:hypothetical protein
MTGSSMANGCDMNGSYVTGSDGTGSDVIFPALFSYYSISISFIWLLGYLVEIPQWEHRRDRKHPWSTTQHLEQIRTHPKGNHKSLSRRSLCIYPGLWLALYRGCNNLLFFSFLYLPSNGATLDRYIHRRQLTRGILRTNRTSIARIRLCQFYEQT